MLGDQPRRLAGVVVARDDEGERRIDRRALGGLEEEDAAVVTAFEDEHRGPAGHHARERDREQVRLRAGVAEADKLDRREALADRRSESHLVAVRRTEGDAVGERRADRVEHDGMRVAVEPGGVLAEEVDVLVAVGVRDARTLAPDDRQRERIEVDDRAGVAAREDARPLLVQPPRLGVALDITALRACDERREIGCGRDVHAACEPTRRNACRPCPPHGFGHGRPQLDQLLF